jgi:hypothetical protein
MPAVSSSRHQARGDGREAMVMSAVADRALLAARAIAVPAPAGAV